MAAATQMNPTEELLGEIMYHFPEFKCTTQDLRNPTEEFVTNFYYQWLQEFEVDLQNMPQIQFSQAKIVNAYQDSYSGLIPKMNLLKSIRAFEVVPDFGMLDIVSPTPKRTQMIIKAFINFFELADINVASIREKREKLIKRKEKRAKMTGEREELKKKLNNKIKNMAKLQDKTVKLEEETVLLQQKTRPLRLNKQFLKNETDVAKEKLKEKDYVIQKLDKENAQVTNKIKECSNMIVDSPSSILIDLNSLQSKENEMKELRDQKRDMLENKLQSENQFEITIKEQELRVEKIEELLILVHQVREKQASIDSLEKGMLAYEEQLNELKSSILALRNKKQNRQEMLQLMQVKWSTLKPQLIENVESSLRELEKRNKEKSELKSDLKESAAVQEKIDSTLACVIKCSKEFEINLEQLKKQDEEHHKSINAALESHMEYLLEEVEEKSKLFK